MVLVTLSLLYEKQLRRSCMSFGGTGVANITKGGFVVLVGGICNLEKS